MMDSILQFFITNAHADTAATAAPQGGGLSFIMMIVIFFIFIYFAIWRPQSKRAKETQTLLNSLAKGDEVVTMGGILGRITKVSEQYIRLTIADNIEITTQKGAVVTVLPKGTLKSIE